MDSLASQARPAAVLWLAGFLQAARLHRVVSFCASSRALFIRIAQCFLLNGLIFLGSLLTLKSMVIPTLLWILPEQCNQMGGQHLCDHKAAISIYSFLRSGLVEIFYVFWFYPLYVFSFILSALWYNDIAKHALDVVKSKNLDSTRASDAHNITEPEDQTEGFDRVALGIGEQVYSILLLTIFFVEVSVIGYIPYFGKAMNFLLLSLMYAYYCFEYKWNFFAVSLNKRLDFFESNWAFFAGFGAPCILPIFFFSPLTSYGLMAILYPLVWLSTFQLQFLFLTFYMFSFGTLRLITFKIHGCENCQNLTGGLWLELGTQAEQVIDELKPAHEGKLQRIPVFFVAKRLTTQVLQLFPAAQKEE
ncbi:Protein EI24-like protein [Dichanthelium oligosanthes]|uniref:Protein EI24-like protein n=1 Tax=Dichanthelium oligosanthes TaxID=888268 RepID=A0A1E5VK95_9POAL|nr:Protein EI24-like protein [Dichanthelium oligosanthes]